MSAHTFLSIVASWHVLGSLLLGLSFLAGPKPDGRSQVARYLRFVALLLAVHGGYLFAPFVLGESSWTWAFWLMAPLALLALLTGLNLFRIALFSRSESKRQRFGRLLAFFGPRHAPLMIVLGACYVAPPIVLWRAAA